MSILRLHGRLALGAAILTLVGSFAACDDLSDDPTGDPNGAGGKDGGSSGTPKPSGPRKASPLPSRGSTVALSADDTRMVTANRDAGTVSVFAIDWTKGPTPEVTKTAEVAVGGEVSQVVIDPNGEFALALSRLEQKLVRIDDLGGTPKAGKTVKTGSEPTGLALTPYATKAYVANFVDGTMQVVDLDTMEVASTVDFNAAIAASGRLGDVNARPALAHPRSIAITNNGNNLDDDETIYVTDFYAHHVAPLAPDGSNADVAKSAVVYKMTVKEPTKVSIIELPPMTDMGFKDHKGGTAGCFPNQLLSINIQGSFGYVLSICASPKGPMGPFTGPANAACTVDATCPGAVAGSCVANKCTTNCKEDSECGSGGKCNANVCAGNLSNVKTTVAPAVSIIDLGSAKTIATVNLQKEFQTYFDTLGLADDANRRMPLTTTDIAFVPGTVNAYLTSRGSDALFRVNFNATYEASNIDSLGDPKAPFISLAPSGIDPSMLGRLPTGVAVAFKLHTDGSNKRFAFVMNENTRNVSVVDLEQQDLSGRNEGRPLVVASSDLPTDAAALAKREGERLFSTGLGRWSMKGQAWAACESCHVDGLSDNVTWFFPRGARQPNSIDGLFDSKDPNNMRLQNWTAIQDEVSDHEMGAIRGTMGGVGAIVKSAQMSADARIAIDKLNQAGLAGSSTAAADPKNPGGMVEACVIDDWSQVKAFFQSIRSMKRPTNLDAAKVEQGRQLFENGNCQGCHGGSKWTSSTVFYAPDPTNATNAALKARSWTTTATAAGFPTALLPAATPANQNMRYNGTAGPDFDQIVCAIRPVGTYGVAEPGVGIAELRKDMVTPSQGNEVDGKGFNPPSLLSMSVGAPYMHAGQVRTLEAMLSSTFSAHTEALKTGFLAQGSPDRDANVAALVQFILSIDEDSAPIAEPALGPNGGSLCSKP